MARNLYIPHVNSLASALLRVSTIHLASSNLSTARTMTEHARQLQQHLLYMPPALAAGIAVTLGSVIVATLPPLPRSWGALPSTDEVIFISLFKN